MNTVGKDGCSPASSGVEIVRAERSEVDCLCVGVGKVFVVRDCFDGVPSTREGVRASDTSREVVQS